MADIGGVDVADRTCTHSGCGERRHSNGYCYRHYQLFVYNPRVRERRAARRRALPPPPSVDERFDVMVDRNGPWPRWLVGAGRCWTWTGPQTGDNYGLFSPGGGARRVRAHRYAYERWTGPIPTGWTIDHLCRDPSCVRHLETVPRATNTARGNDCAKCQWFTRCPECQTDLTDVGIVPPVRRDGAIMHGATPAATFYRNIDHDGPWSELVGGRCWDWPLRSARYASFTQGGVRYVPHQMAVRLDGRVIPPGHVPDHLCERPSCVRGDHLEVVTNGENVRRGKRCTRCRLLVGCPTCGLDIGGCMNADRWQTVA